MAQKRQYLGSLWRILALLALVLTALPVAAAPADNTAGGAVAAPVRPSARVSDEEPATPRVTVLLKNNTPEYDLSTSEFLASQFEDSSSPAHGMVTYTLVSTLTPEALTGSVALVIDESADNSLTDAETTLIHNYVTSGGKLGLFTYPRYYWDLPERPNTAAFQGLADLFGGATIGEPAQSEVESGQSESYVMAGNVLNRPYSLQGAVLATADWAPFSPINSSGTAAAAYSPANDAPVAVINHNGILMTNPIGDELQAGDSNTAYGQFVTDAIVWLANGASLTLFKYNFPLLLQTRRDE